MLDLVEANRVIASFPITPGSKSLPAPIGTWKVVKVTILPIFRWDEAMLKHGRRSANFYTIPPGPRNPVGIVWIGVNKKGIGIHGTDSPDTIGRSASHGCIRLANWDAARVVHQVTVGMTVEDLLRGEGSEQDTRGAPRPRSRPPGSDLADCYREVQFRPCRWSAPR